MPNATYTFVYSYSCLVLLECRQTMVQGIGDVFPKRQDILGNETMH